MCHDGVAQKSDSHWKHPPDDHLVVPDTETAITIREKGSNPWQLFDQPWQGWQFPCRQIKETASCMKAKLFSFVDWSRCQYYYVCEAVPRLRDDDL